MVVRELSNDVSRDVSTKCSSIRFENEEGSMSLFNPSFPIEAAAAVPIRELSRSPARLIDRVERDGEVIALCRYGRLVAVLAPLPERMVVNFETPVSDRSDVTDDAVEVEIPEWVENSEAAQAVLGAALESHPMPYHVDSVRHHTSKAVLVAKSKLELAGFGHQAWRGSFLTPLGLAAARMFRRRLDRGNQPPA